MELNNVLIYNEEHHFQPGCLQLSEEAITAIEFCGAPIEELCQLIDQPGDEWLPGIRYLAVPGLVDIHFHGCMEADVSDAQEDSLRILAAYQGSQGVTTICPATMTLPVAQLHKIMQRVKEYSDNEKPGMGAHFAGINMEGPFVSMQKKGAQAPENIIPCDMELFRQLQRESGHNIRLVDIAPEEPGAMDFISAVKDETAVSVAHTMADYDTAMEAFRRGANHVTHLYNVMPPFHHRNPGVVGAAADAEAYTELIGDGVHIHPAMVRAMFKLLGSHRLCLISDSMRATGRGDCVSSLGGQTVYVQGNLSTLEDGTIAASVTDLMHCLQKVVLEMQVPMEQALQAASETPARSIGIFDRCGSLTVGKQADVVLLDKKLQVQQVIIGGKVFTEQLHCTAMRTGI